MGVARTLVGGVGYRFQRDASFGLAVCDALAALAWPAGVEVADLGYGALHVADDLASARPPWERLILVAAAVRDRPWGTVERRRWTPRAVPPDEVQARIREAGSGVVDLDHLLVIAEHFGALPPDVRVWELEPTDLEGGEGLSAVAREQLAAVLDGVRRDALEPAGRGGGDVLASAAGGRHGPSRGRT